MGKRFYLVAGAIAALMGCVVPTALGAAPKPKNCHALHNCPPASTTTTQPATTTTRVTTTTGAGTTTTAPATTTTTVPATTTTAAENTTTTVSTTTTTQPAGGGAAFLSYPHQSGRQSFSGSNVVVSNRSYVGFTAGACLTVSNATNVWVHDVDFDGCGGAIFLVNVTGTVTIENVRARNTGNGSIGSGQGNIVQFNNVWPCNGVIRGVRALGGDTEDMISIFRSGGCDSAHPLIIENNHLESPLPPSPLAWSSGSGTCINVADDEPATGNGGHDIIVRNNTLLNCGAVGLQMNRPHRVAEHNNIVYGTARATSNVGISQWSGHSCDPSLCSGNSYTQNQVFWQKSGGTASPWWTAWGDGSMASQVFVDTKSRTQDASTPQVHVVL